MKHVIETYEQECDGIYLFGDLGALEFYQKMNFKVANQYRYYVKDEVCNCEKTGERFKPIKDMVRNSVHHSSFEQMNKYGLQTFLQREGT